MFQITILFWTLIIVLFILSFIGILFPIIPSVLVLWGGFLLYHFGLNGDVLSPLFWIMMSLLTIILIASDLLSNSYFVKKNGGSKWAERMASVSVIIGAFVIPPFGLLIIPFLAVFLTELFQKKSKKESLNVAIGSLIGFLGGTVAKIVIQTIMIVWFFLDVFL